MANIGFIGLGHMGLPMAINLLKAGHNVSGFDLNSEAVKALSDAGGKSVSSVIDLAQGQQVIFTMLQTGEQVKQVCLGEAGFYQCAMPGLLHIDCSSIDVESTLALHKAAQQQSIPMLDAPVSGGVKGAQMGSLTLMVGGDINALALAKSYLEVVSHKIVHTGPAGTGQIAKICNNLLLGISMVAVSEAFVLAEKLGLSAEKLFEVVSSSSGQCWAMSQYAPVPGLLPHTPASNHYQPGFTAAMMLKDLNLSQQAAQMTQTHTALGARVTQMYQQLVNEGQGALDFSIIFQQIANATCVE